MSQANVPSTSIRVSRAHHRDPFQHLVGELDQQRGQGHAFRTDGLDADFGDDPDADLGTPERDDRRCPHGEPCYSVGGLILGVKGERVGVTEPTLDRLA